jgi:2-keto-3-deoxy-L-rhamnonate aldolase RhmA
MIKENRLKRMLRQKAKPAGVFVRIPSPAVVEIAAAAGLDFVIMDNEHGAFSDETLENMVRAADATGISALVRVPENRPWAITRTLDMGADGLWVPQVNSQADAEAAVRASRYAPDGQRGMNTACRRAAYGALKRSEYVSRANSEVVLVIQIEDIRAVNTLEEILRVPGIDMISVGLGDLAQSIGFPGQMDHPEVLAIDRKVKEAARGHGLYIAGEDTAKAGSDVGALLDGLRRLITPKAA